MELVGFSDNDMVWGIDDRKSTTGVLYYLGVNPNTWVSQKEKVVALSSCEAEYIAATAGTCQGVWLGRILSNISQLQVKPKLNVDNNSAIALVKNLVYHDQSKHVDTKVHFIRQCVQTKAIKLKYVNTDE